MSDWEKGYIIGGIVGCIITIIVSAFSSASSDSLMQCNLDAFNRINNTSYTLDQWRIYEYAIKKMYPLKGGEE